MREMDFRAIVYLLLSRIKWIILCLVVGALLLGSYTALFLPEEFTSTAMIYVVNQEDTTNTDTATSGNLTASERLVKTVRAATTANWALNQASAKMDRKISAGALGRNTVFSTVAGTSFLKISVTYTDAALARQACNVMAQTSIDAFAATGEKGSARLFQEATIAVKTAPNTTQNTLLGAVAGAAIAVVVILLSAILNNTVRDKEELADRIDVPILGEIPSFELAAKGGRK